MMTLNNVLFVNGATTTLAGVALLAMPTWLSSLFDVNDKVYFTAVGIFFVFFGLFVLYHAFQKNIEKSKLRFITAADWVWVVVSIVLIISLHGTISTAGIFIIGAIALWVALMAFLEGKYM